MAGMIVIPKCIINSESQKNGYLSLKIERGKFKLASDYPEGSAHIEVREYTKMLIVLTE